MNRQKAKEIREFIMDIIDATNNPYKGQINNLINQIIDELTLNSECDKCKYSKTCNSIEYNDQFKNESK